MGAALVLGLLTAFGLADTGSVPVMLDRLGPADLLVVRDPMGSRPVRVLLATRIAVAPDRARKVLIDPASYRKAMPSFRRVEVKTEHQREPGVTDLDIAWELDVPVSNLKGRLWLMPQDHGVDIELSDGDFAPGFFKITVTKDPAAHAGQSLLTVEGHADLRHTSWVLRQLAQHSTLAEPAMMVAASYVLLKALAIYIERGRYERPSAAMAPPDISRLHDGRVWKAAAVVSQPKTALAAVRSLGDGRLASVEVALPVAATVGAATSRRGRPELFRALPGWKKVSLESTRPDECKDVSALCWAVETNMPLFKLDGTWKIWLRPWRARMVAGETKDAVMAVDILPGRSDDTSTLVLSQQPRIGRAGYVARKLIAAEPLLEHGLSLALTLLDAVALVPALEKP
jgi:hypothetical protein